MMLGDVFFELHSFKIHDAPTRLRGRGDGGSIPDVHGTWRRLRARLVGAIDRTRGWGGERRLTVGMALMGRHSGGACGALVFCSPPSPNSGAGKATVCRVEQEGEYRQARAS